MKSSPKFLRVRSPGIAKCGCRIEKDLKVHVYHKKHRTSALAISILCPTCGEVTSIKRSHLQGST